jgi:phosphatidylglycerophosphate synthase
MDDPPRRSGSRASGRDSSKQAAAWIEPIRNENRDVSYRYLAPLYGRIAAKVPRQISPNQLSLLGLGCAVMAATVLMAWSDPLACLAAGVLVLLFGMFDCIDGMHARNTGQSSLFGAYLDAVVDVMMAAIIYPALIVRYELYAPIYVFTACFRLVVACMIHACTAETRVRIDPEFGSVSENLTMSAVLFAAGAFPGAVNLVDMTGPEPWWKHMLVGQKLAELTVVKGAMLFAALALLFTAVRGLLETKAMLASVDIRNKQDD